MRVEQSIGQVAWDPSLAVGHAQIDAQHQELFRRFGRLVDAMEAGRSADIAELFQFLAQYAVEHFGAEERLMDDTHYPGAAIHKAAHARFVRDYGDLVALYEANGTSRAVVVKARTWIGGWLRAHIMGVDLALARFLHDAPGS
jgi:hemerythrin